MNREQRRSDPNRNEPAASPVVQHLFTAAIMHHQAGRVAETERLLRQILAIDSRHSDSLHVLGVIAIQTGHNEQAVELIRRSITINPREPSAHANLGNLMREQGKLKEAIALYRKSLNLRPDAPAVLNDLAGAFQAMGRAKEAIATWQKSLSFAPNDADTHYHLALALLARGDMASGWKEYEWRWKTPRLAPAERRFTEPRWLGEPAPGKTLLIHAEQELADTIQFCRYAPLAAARGLRVILEVPAPLVPLLRGLPGVEQVVARDEALPAFDLHCPMLSLPLAFGTTVATIPAAVPYLRADPARTEAWRARLATPDDRHPRVGLVWAESPGQAADPHPIDADQIAPLFELAGPRFINLRNDGPAPFAPAEIMPETDDLADTAALIANLDLIISVDGPIAHLAAAMGRPVWLLDRFESHWRWLTGRRDSPWYPGLLIYRQPQPNDRASVLAEVARDLRALA